MVGCSELILILLLFALIRKRKKKQSTFGAGLMQFVANDKIHCQKTKNKINQSENRNYGNSALFIMPFH